MRKKFTLSVILLPLPYGVRGKTDDLVRRLRFPGENASFTPFAARSRSRPVRYDGFVSGYRRLISALLFTGAAAAQTYTAPAGIRPPVRKAHAAILPGGRIIAPAGQEYATRGAPFGMALSASGNTIALADTGPWVSSLTVLERSRNGIWEGRNIGAHVAGALDDFAPADWRTVSIGVACAGDRGVYLSEGNSGRVAYFDASDERRRTIDLNQPPYKDSYTGDLAIDNARNLLYVADQANNRVAVVDTRNRQILASVKTGRLPFALALSPDRQKLYVTNAGTFNYRPVPDIDPSNLAASGLTFPAFGFPSAEALSGAQRQTGRGPVTVPALGDPNAPEANSLAVIDVATPNAPKFVAFIRTGKPVGANAVGGSSPSGVVAFGDRVFVSNANNDSISVIDAATNTVTSEIPIRIPGLEQLRGVIPLGLAYVPDTNWLLVAEAGINASGVIDVATGKVLGHIPAAWYPTRVAVDGESVVVAAARGHGSGPSGPGMFTPAQLHQGSVSMFTLPGIDDLAGYTATVMNANGFIRSAAPETPLPAGIKHVVLIVKENRSYDEVLGDILEASNGHVLGAPALAYLGESGSVDGRHIRISIRDANLTPNHHAIARRWAFSDNFHAESEGSIEGHRLLAGISPNGWTLSSAFAAYGGGKDFRLEDAPGRRAFAGVASSVQPEDESEAGTIWDHFARHGVSFFNFGEGFELPGVAEAAGMDGTGARFVTNTPMPGSLFANTSRTYPGFNIHIPDQKRADALIRELDAKYVRNGTPLPQFIYVHLPGDYMAPPRPADGYPYAESFMVDNDYALGRIVEYLSHTPDWKAMAIFITEDSASGGADHIDAHRTVLLCAGPYAKANYASHANTGFSGLFKTIFRLLGVPPLTLADATAADLSDCFRASSGDFAPYTAKAPDKRIFDPAFRPGGADGNQPK